MKRYILVVMAAALAFTAAADARNIRLELSLQDLVQSPQAKEAGIDGSVRFFMAGQSPVVLRRMSSDVSNRKTNAANKSDEEACRWAALSALLAFQKNAKERGANAVVDIVSYYKKNEFRSATNFECFAGSFVAGVALKGTYAQVR